MSLHLVTGYAGEAHITSADAGSFNLAMMGNGQYVLDRGNKFSATIQSNTKVRILDGDILMQGRHIRQAKDTYTDLTFSNGVSGSYRNDLIVARYEKDTTTGVEKASLVVIEGESSTDESAVVDPEYNSGDITEESGDTINDMPLYRVQFNGLTIQTPVALFDTLDTWKTLQDEAVETYEEKLDDLVEQTEKAVDQIVFANPHAHNAIFRGKDLTDVYTIDEISEMIQAGTFDDLFLGDYITVEVGGEEMDWVFAGFDYFLHNGNTELITHHAIMIPKDCFSTTQQMNTSNVTTGGYVGSNWYTSLKSTIFNNIISAFGSDHVLQHKRLLSKSISTSGDSMAGAGRTGYANGWDWYDSYGELMTEPMVYGTMVLSSSFYDVGDGQMQIPLFKVAPDYKIARKGKNGSRQWWWLSAVSTSTNFCGVSLYGYAGGSGASGSYGVRPYFLLS